MSASSDLFVASDNDNLHDPKLNEHSRKVLAKAKPVRPGKAQMAVWKLYHRSFPMIGASLRALKLLD